jgi:hypothetical protein
MLSSTTGLACPRTTRRKWHGPRSMFVNYLTIPNRLARLGLGYAWDCLDHVVVFGERHLRDLLNSYQKYYNEARTHLSLHKDAPIPRPVQTVGRTLAMPVLGGLHHQYFRA